MTGFAQGKTEFNDISLSISFKSLNHRYLDVSFKGTGITPRSEKMIKEIIRERVHRGKLEIVFNLFDSRQKKFDVQFNQTLLEEILDCLQPIRARYGDSIDLSLDFLLKIPMIFHLEYIAEDFVEDEWREMQCFIEKVFNDFMKTREDEGSYILNSLLPNIKKIEKSIALIKSNAGDLEKEIYLKYKEKIRKILEDHNVDDNRILQEAAILAEKNCINEEISRLETHTQRLKALLEDKKMEIKGKEADFLTQEMQRETHTIASKTDSQEIHRYVLETRREIEKIKQQVQNVE